MRTIKFKGVYLDVYGNYEPLEKGDRFNPPFGGYFELTKIMLEGTDITDLLERDIDEIESLVLEEIENDSPF